MICRLCLLNIHVENKVTLFNEMESDDDESSNKMIKLIAKYLYLEITPNDALSTTICLECYHHLDEFNNFCKYIERQQQTLQKEFLEVKCDIQVVLNEVEISIENVNDKSVLDINDALIDSYKSDIDKNSAVSDVDDIWPESYISEEDRNSEGFDDKDIFEVTDDEYVPPNRLTKSVKKRRQHIDLGDGDDDQTAEKVTEQKITDEKKIHDADKRDEFIAKHMQLKCELCDLSMDKFIDLRRHFKESHDDKPYIVCCGVRLGRRTEILNHIQWHLNPEHFKCVDCGKIFKSNSSLSFHIVRKHQKSEDLIFECNACDKNFARKGCLNQHIANHHAEKTFICEHCDSGFVSYYRLIKHIRAIHDNFFPHICDTCGKKFKYKPSFESHVQEHQGIVTPAVQCKLCGEWKKSKWSLRSHIQSRHSNKPSMKCKYCDKVFNRKCSLKEHEAKHTDTYLYNCPHCIKDFRSHANMYVHIKQKHLEEWLAAKLDPDAKKDREVNELVHTLRLVKQEAADLFPIATEEKLEEIDSSITSDNINEFVATMNCLLYDNIGNLKNIISTSIALAYNVDGSHGMKRLKTFSNFFSALLAAIEALPSSEGKDPLNLLKHGFRLQKKRTYKKTAKKKRSVEEP